MLTRLPDEGESMDALSELLRVIRLTGTAFIDAELKAPWAVRTPAPEAIAARLAPGAGRIIPYHVVTEGACQVEVAGQAPIPMSASEVIVLPHGDQHVLASAPGLSPMQITTELVAKLTRPDAIAQVRHGGDGAKTRLICGFFACDAALSGHLVARFPKVMHSRFEEDSAATLLPKSARPSANGPRPGAGAVLGKLSELLFVDAIRSYIESTPGLDGWLAGLKDRYAGQALALIYAQPDHAWTLESLAKAVGVSRTALAEHFARCTGMAPMQYLTQWRLQLAADALAQSDEATKTIAGKAGFASTSAFNRAFKREFGVPPVAWRRRRRKAAGTRTV